jgi:hypothetical protein
MWKRVDFSAVGVLITGCLGRPFRTNKTHSNSHVAAVWPFQSQGQEQISLNLGDSLHISDSYEGQWYKGENLSTGETGIFPTHGFVELRPNWDHTTVELDQTIREWTTLLKDYFQVCLNRCTADQTLLYKDWLSKRGHRFALTWYSGTGTQT